MQKLFTLFILLSLINPILSAQSDTKVDTMYQIEAIEVVYQAANNTPITFQNINAKTFRAKSTGQEPSFLLSETPSVTAYSDAGSGQGYSYFRIRGIDQTRINITLDGVPINEPEDQGAYFSNYPDLLNSVSKIQIQRGVGTTKNGVASYGGSVQLFSPQLYRPRKTTVGIGYGSFNSWRAFASFNSGIKNGKGIAVSASQVYSDGYKNHSSNNSRSIFLSGGLFGDKSSWKINALIGQQANDMAWLGVSNEQIEVDRQTNNNAPAEQDKFTQSLIQLQNKWQINPSSFLHTSVYYTYLTGDYDFDLNNFLGFPSTEELYNYDFLSHLIGIYSNYTFSKNQLNWTTGLHANTYNRRHLGSEKTIGELYSNTGYKNEASIYSKADYTFEDFTFFADLQYRYASFEYEGAVELIPMDWSFINPKVGLTYSLKNNSILYYSLGRTGREPTRNDIFGGNDDLLADSLGNALTFVSSPEYVLDHELGWRYQTKQLSVDVNFFYMDFQDEIVLDGKFGPNGLALTNKVEQSIRTGIETSVTYQINEKFSLLNNSSFNHSRIKEQEEIFTPILTPALIINQEVIYQHQNLTIGLSARYQDASFIDFANTVELASYFLLNGRIAYEWKGLQLGLFANNITNQDYFNNGYVDFDGSQKYFVQAPTNFYTTLKYSF